MEAGAPSEPPKPKRGVSFKGEAGPSGAALGAAAAAATASAAVGVSSSPAAEHGSAGKPKDPVTRRKSEGTDKDMLELRTLAASLTAIQNSVEELTEKLESLTAGGSSSGVIYDETAAELSAKSNEMEKLEKLLADKRAEVDQKVVKEIGKRVSAM